MIENFDDFCLWMYAMVDDVWRQIAPLFKRPGPAAECSDRELMTMALVGECRGWDVETDMLCQWRERRDLFPHIPSQSRFNRRRRGLMHAFNVMHQTVLRMLDLAADQDCAIDSLPIPVVKFHLVPSASREWAAYGADFGRVPSKKQTIFGFKLHLLVTLNGVILDFDLAPASAADLTIGAELLAEHRDLTVFGNADETSDGYISAQFAADLLATRGVRLLTLPRRNQKRQLPQTICHLFNAVRQIIETVNGQLTEQFNIQVNHAHSVWGLCTRLLTKLTAHTLCSYLNPLLANPDCLHIKSLPFPN